MPGGDGTGPSGLGPMTGRTAGYCAGYPMPGYMNPVPGRGFGIGRGKGQSYGYESNRVFQSAGDKNYRGHKRQCGRNNR